MKDGIAAITGGASGLGEACTRLLAEGGVKVAILDLQVDRGEKLASELGKNAVFIKTDVTSEESTQAAINQMVETFGGLKLDQMDLIEINEAFAAMPLVSTKILAENDEKKWKALQDRTNVNGGAIAIGHPVGASAGRITMTLAYELRRRGGGYGVASICGGLAMGEAVILKV